MRCVEPLVAMFGRGPAIGILVIAVAYLSCFVMQSDGLAVMSVDLGSEFMKVAIVKPGVPMEIALNYESRRKTPVAVSFRDNERLFGDGAMSVAVKYPKNAYIYVHDVLGKSFKNPLVQQYRQRFPWYDLEEDKEMGTVVFRHDSETTFTPEEILGMILNHSRVVAEKFADHPMKDVVITVPPFFNQAERRAVLRAAKLVGLNVLQLMNDNTAVALHYAVFRHASFNGSEKYIMFYDMGASSTVATIVGYSTVKTKDRGITEKSPQVAIKGVGFDRTLGGHAMELRMRDHLVKLFKEKYKGKNEVTESPRAMAKFLKEAVRVKKVLSANSEIFAQIEGAFEDQDFRAKVTREEFEKLCDDLLKRVPDPVNEALKASSITLDEIETVILVGGGTRVPKVQELLLEAVKKSELGRSVNTDEAAALGAVYQAAHLGKGFKVKTFHIKDANVYPVQVSFERPTKAEDGSKSVKHVKRMLYHRMNVVPQKKVMTFNRHSDDFHFYVCYSELDFLSEQSKRILGSANLTTVSVKGVAAALAKHTPAGDPKGVKAFFKMDENGFLILEKVESVFEKMPEETPVEEQSTFAKIGSKISSFFSGSAEKEEKKKEQTKEAGEKPDETKEEKGGTGAEKPEKEKPAGEPKAKDEEKPEETSSEKEGGEKSTEKSGEGKREDEKKNDEKKEEDKGGEEKQQDTKKTEEKAEEKTESPDERTDTGKKEEKVGNETDGVKKEKAEERKPSKPVTVREPLEMSLQWVDLSDTTNEMLSLSIKKLADLQAQDEAKAAKEKARNNLESHVFEMREMLYGEIGELLSTEEEREKIDQALTETSDWLDDEGWDTTADVYAERLQKVKKPSYDFRKRLKEHQERPKALGMIKNSLNLSRTFLVQINNITDKNEIYTAKDLEDIEKVIAETTEWLERNEKKQNETKTYEDPVLLVKDIEAKQGKLDRELLYLLNKAKYYVPKPKTNDTAESADRTANKTKPGDEGKTEEESKKEEKDEKLKEDEAEKTGKVEEGAKEEENREGRKDAEKVRERKPEQVDKDEKKNVDGEEPLSLPDAESSEPTDSSSSSSAESSNEQQPKSETNKKAQDEL